MKAIDDFRFPLRFVAPSSTLVTIGRSSGMGGDTCGWGTGGGRGNGAGGSEGKGEGYGEAIGASSSSTGSSYARANSDFEDGSAVNNGCPCGRTESDGSGFGKSADDHRN